MATAKTDSNSRKRASNPNRGSKPGERRGGRQKGTPNKVTVEVRALAQEYGEEAVRTLAAIMKDKEQPAAARVAAAREILDRGYGKTPQPISDAEGGSLSDAVQRLIEGLPS